MAIEADFDLDYYVGQIYNSNSKLSGFMDCFLKEPISVKLHPHLLEHHRQTLVYSCDQNVLHYSVV